MKTRVYIASHSQEEAKRVARFLRSKGFEICSSWIRDKHFGPAQDYLPEECARIAERDAREVSASDMLVLISGPDKYTGGKFVEAGIALGLHKPIVVVGRKENMLMWHPDICVLRHHRYIPLGFSAQRPRQ